METRTNNNSPSPIDETKYQEMLDQEARLAAYKVGPRVYRLTGIDTDPVRFFVLGCHGNGKKAQRDTAALMNQIADELQQSGEPTPSFILFLGDNIYDYGVSTPSTPAFNDCFHYIYYDESMTVTSRIPCLMLLGNHDVNMHGKAILSSNASGDDTGINQAAHTYIANIPANIRKKAALYQQDELPVNQLSHWNMPYLYYSVIAGNTQIFCLNSSSYLQEYLELQSGKVVNGINTETGRVNQAWWFEKEYNAAKKAGRQIFIAQHHPLFVSGKRSFPAGFDYNHYLTWQQVLDLNAKLKRANPAFKETASYNSLLASTFEQQGIAPDLVFAAHEHFISYYNDIELQKGKQPLRQFTSGGGGGDLQKRTSYRGHPHVGMHQQHNGFGMVTCDPDHTNEFTIDVFTNEGLRMRFDESSQHPIMQKNDDLQVEKLRKCVLTACDRYFTALKAAEIKAFPAETALQEKQDKNATGFYSFFSKKITDVWQSVYDASNVVMGFLFHDAEHDKENRIVQDIHAYFSQIELPDLQAALEHLFRLTRTLPYLKHESDAVFYKILQNAVRENLGFDLRILFQAANLYEIAPIEYASTVAFKT